MFNHEGALGRLETIPLREVWPSEPAAFTTWLAQKENLKLLGETIDRPELTLEQQEKEVGPYRADLLCKGACDSNEWVVIENQLEKTDHDHLGKMLTYAAGLQAATTVWIAERFTDKHRATLDWLNDITDSRFNFFGLEIQLWRIGDSAAAPKFNIVSKPNGWSQTVRATTGNSATERLQLEYWTAFHDFLKERGSKLKPRKALPTSELHVTIGETGVWVQGVASRWDSVARNYDNNEIRVELVIQHEELHDYFDSWRKDRGAIEQAVGSKLSWQEPTEKRRIISMRRPVDLEERDGWEEQYSWLLDNLEAFCRVFKPRIEVLKNAKSASGKRGDAAGA